MPTNPLTKEESTALRDAAAEKLRWCNAVVKRLQDRGYCPNDALLRHALDAIAAMQAFFMAAHYEGCDGVGK